jgi:hypothetical protein
MNLYKGAVIVAHRPGLSRPGGVARLISKVLLAAALLALSGCVSGVSVSTHPSLAPPAVATATPEQHNLMVIGVDFDPSLDYEQIVANGGISLMAAIQNDGLEDETGVRVTARLIDPEAGAGQGELLNETVTLASVSAGKLAVARFPQVSMLPLRRRSPRGGGRYRLEVQIEAARDERNLADNFRAFDIRVPPGE